LITVYRNDQHPNRLVSVPMAGSRAYRVQFTDNVATVPDAVGTILLGMGEAHYIVNKQFEGGIEPGTKALVIRDMGIGDVLLTTPLIRKLHKAGAVVTCMTAAHNMWIYENNPHVSEIRPLNSDDGKRDGFPIVLNLMRVVENAEVTGLNRHRADAFAAEADFTLTPGERHLDYFMTKAEARHGKDYVKTCLGPHFGKVPLKTKRRGIVAYVWRASRRERSWVERTHRLMLESLSSAGYASIIMDGERMNLQDLPDGCTDATGQLTMRELAAVMKACDACIVPDTGPFHLAGALDVPTISYFSTMPVEERHAHKNLTMIQAGKEACGLWPCRKYECRLAKDEHGQPKCLAVSGETLVSAVNKVMEAKK
jgi:Glycosyltransferase family 9 (heptosyltransferase)